MTLEFETLVSQPLPGSPERPASYKSSVVVCQDLHLLGDPIWAASEVFFIKENGMRTNVVKVLSFNNIWPFFWLLLPFS